MVAVCSDGVHFSERGDKGTDFATHPVRIALSLKLKL